MPAVQWPLHMGRPMIEVDLSLPSPPHVATCRLVADTGAGSEHAVFQLIMDEQDCLAFGGVPLGRVQLRGAYVGVFPLYLVQVGIARLHFDEFVEVVGVGHPPSGFDGIACFKFLDRFHYGNFAKSGFFGLAT